MNKCSFILFVLLLGCSYFVSWEESVEGGVGRPIDDIIETWGAPESIKEYEDGRKRYKYHLNKLDPSCIHYWIVREGLIVDFEYEGYCRPVG